MDKNHLHIKIISAQETYPVRHPILRAGRPLEDCHFEGDDLDSTFHIGLFDKEKLVGVASFFKNTNTKFDTANQYQLRGMAILSSYQGKGLGKLILQYGENELKTLNTILLWCNARERAVTFYEKQNYKKTGEPFDIKGIGTHFLMYKKL